MSSFTVVSTALFGCSTQYALKWLNRKMYSVTFYESRFNGRLTEHGEKIVQWKYVRGPKIPSDQRGEAFAFLDSHTGYRSRMTNKDCTPRPPGRLGSMQDISRRTSTPQGFDLLQDAGDAESFHRERGACL